MMDETDVSFEFGKPLVEAAHRLNTLAERSRRESPAARRYGLDPFSLPVQRHRQFQDIHENDYSDWLDWILGLIQTCWDERDVAAIYSWLLLGQAAFSPANPTTTFDADEDRTREVRVAKGHRGQSGRLDILRPLHRVEQVWHLEVKVGPGGDLLKNDGYAESVRNRHDGYSTHNVLLTTSGAVCMGFHPLKWEDLVRRLREFAVMDKVPSLLGGIVLLFCAVVEQQLLGILPDSPTQYRFLTERDGGDAVEALYKAGLDKYAQTQFAICCFEKHVDDVVQLALETRKVKINELAGLHGGAPYGNHPGISESVGLTEWWAWVARKYWLERLQSTLYIGLQFIGGGWFAAVALAPDSGTVRKRLHVALRDEPQWEWNEYEFVMQRPLDADTTARLHAALGECLDQGLIPLLMRCREDRQRAD